MNLFFELNKYLAKLMDPYAEYDVSMTEIHHTEKKDAPSGTAISLAEQILSNIGRKDNWINDKQQHLISYIFTQRELTLHLEPIK